MYGKLLFVNKSKFDFYINYFNRYDLELVDWDLSFYWL